MLELERVVVIVFINETLSMGNYVRYSNTILSVIAGPVDCNCLLLLA
jgi:hypothetical protein